MAGDFELPEGDLTNADIIGAIQVLHTCFDAKIALVRQEIRRNAKSSAQRSSRAVTKMTLLEGDMKRVKSRLGLSPDAQTPPETIRPSFLSMPWPHATWRVVLIVGPLMAVWNLFYGSLPSLVRVAEALLAHH